MISLTVAFWHLHGGFRRDAVFNIVSHVFADVFVALERAQLEHLFVVRIVITDIWAYMQVGYRPVFIRESRKSKSRTPTL